MTISNRVLFAGVLLGGGLLASIANAAITYTYVTDEPVYNAAANGTVTVTVFLQETLTGSTSLIASDGGLFSDAFSVTRTGALPATPAALTSITADTAIYPSGTDPINTLNASASFTDVGAASNSLASGSVLPNGDGLIELGTVVITAGGPGTTSFTLNSYKPGGGWTTTLDNDFDLDLGSTSSPAFTGAQNNPLNETFEVVVPSAVPEPASLALLGLGGLSLLARRRRV